MKLKKTAAVMIMKKTIIEGLWAIQNRETGTYIHKDIMTIARFFSEERAVEYIIMHRLNRSIYVPVLLLK